MMRIEGWGAPSFETALRASSPGGRKRLRRTAPRPRRKTAIQFREKASSYASGLKPTSNLPRASSSTGRLIIEGCASINLIAFASVIPSLSSSGSFLNVVPARFRSVSQPVFFAQLSKRPLSIPRDL